MSMRPLHVLATAFVAVSCLQAPRAAEPAAQDAPQDVPGRMAVRAGVLHTMAGPPIEDAVLLIDGGRITAVGPASQVAVPAGWSVREAAVVTPGLIDARSSVGLAGWLNVEHDKDEVDRSESIQPELRALDAYNAREPLVEYLKGFGITTVHTGHAPAALISGQTMVVKLRGGTVDDAVLVPEAMLAAALGSPARRDKNPGTRSKSAAMLRAALVGAQEYAAKRASAAEGEAPPRDLRQEALGRVLSGETPLLVYAQRAHDIVTALRLAQEFPGLRLVLDGACEAPLVLDEILAAGVPVICHPTMQRAGEDTKSLSMETPRLLLEAGVPTALQSGYEGYVPRTRVVLFEAAVAARAGLSFERALGLITLDAARLLGVDERVGSLEVGKDGDVALFDGDPFEYTTHCIGTLVEGVPTSSVVR
jgi:imidazolonepropionase-like amidohydrolase